MRLNELTPSGRESKKRVGRGIGSGRGKTAGRGHKGQNSRTGGGVPAGFEGGQQPLQRRLPKFGFNSAKARTTAEVTLTEIGKVEGDVADLAALKKAGILSGAYTRAKVMLSGEINRAVTLKGIRATKGARAAIEAAGGKVEE